LPESTKKQDRVYEITILIYCTLGNKENATSGGNPKGEP
jgi:hypothetical protein